MLTVHRIVPCLNLLAIISFQFLMIKILITGAGSLLGQEIYQSLQRTSLLSDLFIGFADPSPLAAGLHWADASHFLPMASCDDYIEKLISVIHSNSYEYLIPGTDVELPKIALFRSQIESRTGCQVIVSSPSVIDIANDKFLTFSFLQSNGFSPPQSWTKDSLELEDLSHLPFPLIVKPRNGARSIGVLQVNCIDHLQDAILSTDNPIIQECIGSPDAEYTAGSFTFKGKCLATILLRRTLKDGNTWTAQVVNDTTLQSVISSISETLNPNGPCNFQFRLDSCGYPRVFEINARFSGTTYMRSLSGFDEVAWSLLCARDGCLPFDLPHSFNELMFMRSHTVTCVPSSTLI